MGVGAPATIVDLCRWVTRAPFGMQIQHKDGDPNKLLHDWYRTGDAFEGGENGRLLVYEYAKVEDGALYVVQMVDEAGNVPFDEELIRMCKEKGLRADLPNYCQWTIFAAPESDIRNFTEAYDEYMYSGDKENHPGHPFFEELVFPRLAHLRVATALEAVALFALNFDLHKPISTSLVSQTI